MVNLRYYFILLLFLESVIFAYSQTKKETKDQLKAESQGYIISDITNDKLSLEDSSGSFHFTFPQLSKHFFYYNRAELDKINELLELGDKDVELLKALEKYVYNFGIKNFSENTDLLWKLAQVYEKYGEIEKAKAAYLLVLKHHKTDVFKEIKSYFSIRSHFDSLIVNEKNYYVPLEYYYELVEYRKQIDTISPPKSILLNMGDLVNASGIADYGPSINRKDDFMIFTRKEIDQHIISRSKHFNEDLYHSKNNDGFWMEAEKFPEPINSRCNEGSACLSRDGKTLFFSRCFVQDYALDCSDCMGKCDIYVSYLRDDGKWTKPENLGPEVNSIAWDSHPSLSATEDTLFFASDRPGGFGLSDIYFTVKNKKDKWTKAQNIGPVINTRNNEYSPFVNWVHGVFYFSSNGQLFNFYDVKHMKKVRTLDIYKTKLHSGYQEEPKNVGPLVNGLDNEFYFSIDSKAEFLYYAKTEEGAQDQLQTDLFSFPVPMEARPDATSTLKGKLSDRDNGKPYDAIVSVIDLDNGIEVAPKNTRPDGSYEFDLIPNNNYLLVIQGDDFFRIEELFKMKGDTTIESKGTSVKNKKLQFSSVVFENGKSEIRDNMEKDLWDVINFLVDHPDFDLVIGGHTDLRGDKAANKKLSQDRADAIKKYIEENGYITSDRITAIGYGSEKPIRSPELTEADARINRRVEFEIRHKSEREGKQFSDDDFQSNDGFSEDDSGW